MVGAAPLVDGAFGASERQRRFGLCSAPVPDHGKVRDRDFFRIADFIMRDSAQLLPQLLVSLAHRVKRANKFRAPSRGLLVTRSAKIPVPKQPGPLRLGKGGTVVLDKPYGL